MRTKYIFVLTIAILLLASSALYFLNHRHVPVKSVPILAMHKEEEEEESEEQEAGMIDQRMEHEFNMLKDPRTGKIPDGINAAELMAAKAIPLRENISSSSARIDNLNTYQAAGPSNAGGRTRAVVFDKRYGTGGNQVIMSGSVSGGIFRSTDGGSNWTRVTPENILHNVTAIAQDTHSGSENTWYAGGGEAIGNSAAGVAGYFGYGILKSTDNGATWTQLTLTVTNTDGSVLAAGANEVFDNVFDIVHKIVVSPVNGYVYICGHRRLVRSTDGGASFNVVFGGPTAANTENGQMDIAVSSTGRLVLAVNGGLPDLNLRGVWTSTTGNFNSWVRLAGGQTAGVDSLSGWRGNSYTPANGSYAARRILVALAPSNQNILYVLYQNGLSQSSANGANPEADLFKIDLSANTYANLSANMPDFPGQKDGVDPFAVQGGYDMLVAVKPDNPNMVFVGGTNIYRSTDGFASTTNTEWIGGYSKANPPSYGVYANSHPDIHNLVFDPSNANRALCANDGGLQVTTDVTAATVSWSMVSNYQTLQYYFVALDPNSGQNNFLGGAQDNGCYVRQAGTTTPNNQFQVISGDGTEVGIGSAKSPDFTLFFSVAQGNIYRDVTNTFTTITPSGLTANPTGGYGDFVTYFKLDFDNPQNLYYVNFNRLFRTKNATTVTSSGWEELTGVGSAVNPANPSGTNIYISAMEVSRGTYQTTHTLYIGTNNAKLYRLDDPANALTTAAPKDITPAGMTGYVSDIAVNPNNDAEVLVTLSNYGVVSMWWTNTAKSDNPVWKNVEGNLSVPSARSCMIVVKKNASNVAVTEYYVGTSAGLYSTTDMSATSVSWVREGGNVLNYAIVTALDYRPQDNVLLVGTHGNGMYYSSVGTPNFTPDVSTGINTPVRNDRNFIVSAYPTLGSSQITYHTGNMYTVKKLVIKVYTVQGQAVIDKETGYTNGTVDIGNLAKGAYVLTITSSDNKQQFITKFVKE